MNNIYLSTSSDGINTEGIGAMVQYQLHVYAYSRINNLKYAFFGFKNMQHYQYFNISQEKFSQDINNFFNFPNELKSENYELIKNIDLNTNINFYIEKYKNNEKNIVFEVSPSSIMKFADTNIIKIEKEKILKNLKNQLILEDKCKYFSNNYMNISIHIRKFMPTDCDLSAVREYFTLEDRNKIFNILNQTILKFDNTKRIKIHVYSQGKEEDLMFLNSLNNDNVETIFHIEEYPLISLYHMINSDIMIGSNSSFSYISHLYRDSINLFRDNFYHSLYQENTYFYDRNGNIVR